MIRWIWRWNDALDLHFILMACFMLGLSYIAYRDWIDFRIPDHATIPLGALGLVWIALFRPEAWFFHAGAALVGGFIFWLIAALYKRLRGKDGLGLGDAKLVAVGGFWLGLDLAFAIALGTGIALGATLALIVLKLRGRGDPIPLGFYLAIGFIVTSLFS